jgi:hypothetical protein
MNDCCFCRVLGMIYAPLHGCGECDLTFAGGNIALVDGAECAARTRKMRRCTRAQGMRDEWLEMGFGCLSLLMQALLMRGYYINLFVVCCLK